MQGLTTFKTGEVIQKGEQGCSEGLGKGFQVGVRHVLDTLADQNWQKSMIGGCSSGINDVVEARGPLQVNDGGQGAQGCCFDVLQQ